LPALHGIGDNAHYAPIALPIAPAVTIVVGACLVVTVG